MGTGTIHGGHEAVQDVRDERSKKEAALAAKEKGAGFGSSDGSTGSTQFKAVEDAEKKLADFKQKQLSDSLTKEQKIAILKKTAQLADENNILTKDRKQRAELMLQGEQAKAQLADLLKEGVAKKRPADRASFQIDALQSAGAYVRGDSKILTPIQQSERHLRELVTLTKQNPGTVSGF